MSDDMDIEVPDAPAHLLGTLRPGSTLQELRDSVQALLDAGVPGAARVVSEGCDCEGAAAHLVLDRVDGMAHDHMGSEGEYKGTDFYTGPVVVVSRRSGPRADKRRMDADDLGELR